MKFKIKISDEARKNIKDSAAYYKDKASIKVAQDFILDYEFTLKKIIQNPYFQIYYKNFRGLPMKKYPFIIFYQIDEENKLILVNAVFNAKQNTEKRPS